MVDHTFTMGELLTADLVNNELNGATAAQVPSRVAAGTVYCTVAANTTAKTTVTLPTGRFTKSPMVTATLASSNPKIAQVSVAGIGTAQFDVWVANPSTTGSITIEVQWHAVQMTPSSAVG